MLTYNRKKDYHNCTAELKSDGELRLLGIRKRLLPTCGSVTVGDMGVSAVKHAIACDVRFHYWLGEGVVTGRGKEAPLVNIGALIRAYCSYLTRTPLCSR